MQESNQHYSELLLKRKSGSSFPGETFTSAVLDKQQRLTGFVSIVRDITHRKEILNALHREKEKAQVTKMF